MLEIYEEDFIVRTWDVDAYDGLTLAAAFNYCQEIAGIHAAKLGVGLEAMQKDGVAWILSRMSLELNRRPGWGSSIRCRTWPCGADRLLVFRDYELCDEKGVFARGRSAWLIVNMESKRLLRPGPWLEKLPENKGRIALADGAPSLVAPDQKGAVQAKSFKRSASYSDIDYNGHVNNSRYIQWVQDCFTLEELASLKALRCDINYVHEVKEGEELDIKRIKTDDGWWLEGILLSEGASSFKLQIRPFVADKSK